MDNDLDNHLPHSYHSLLQKENDFSRYFTDMENAEMKIETKEDWNRNCQNITVSSGQNTQSRNNFLVSCATSHLRGNCI